MVINKALAARLVDRFCGTSKTTSSRPAQRPDRFPLSRQPDPLGLPGLALSRAAIFPGGTGIGRAGPLWIATRMVINQAFAARLRVCETRPKTVVFVKFCKIE